MNDFGITPELVALVKKEEGWVDHPYLCPAGHPTIGWGHRISSMDHPKITPLEGERYLWADLRFHRDAALKLSPSLADEPPARLAAITDFCYNCGPVAYGKSRLRLEVGAKNWGRAGMEMRKWVWYTEPVTKKRAKLAGLIRRRAVTAQWLEAGR